MEKTVLGGAEALGAQGRQIEHRQYLEKFCEMR
jgi:hypothetical protein